MIMHGPYGGTDEGGTNWSVDAGRIRKVTVKHGFIVDGIGFETIDGTDTWFGGLGGGVSEVILSPDDYIIQITGTYGVWVHTGEQVISSLKIHTDKCPQGYGPFGMAMDVDDITPFSSTLIEDHAVVALCGTFDDYLTSIMAYSKKQTQKDLKLKIKNEKMKVLLLEKDIIVKELEKECIVLDFKATKSSKGEKYCLVALFVSWFFFAVVMYNK